MNILFQGDSLTDSGRDRNAVLPNRGLGDGYVNLIAAKLTGKYPDKNYNILNRGVSGNRSCDIYSRWREDTVNIDFDILSIMLGINDIGFELRLNRGCDIEKYEFIYRRMLWEVEKSHKQSKVVLVSPLLFKVKYDDETFGCDIYDDWNKWSGIIKEQGEVVKKLSKEFNALYIPMFDIFQDLCGKYDPALFSIDGIHLLPAGCEIFSEEWLKYVNNKNWL